LSRLSSFYPDLQSPNKVGGNFDYRTVAHLYLTSSDLVLQSNARRIALIATNWGAKGVALGQRKMTSYTQGFAVIPSETTHKFLFKDFGSFIWSEIHTIAVAAGGDIQLTEIWYIK